MMQRQSLPITLLLLLFIFSLPVVTTAQKLKVKIGFELGPNLLFQKVEGDEFYNESSLDITGGAGVKVNASLHSIGFGTGLYYTRLGFNKNNPASYSFLFLHGEYYLDRLKCKGDYLEIPVDLHYTFTHKRLNLNVGVVYSYYRLMRSFARATYYEQHANDMREMQAQEMQEILRNGFESTTQSFLPYAELEIKFQNISFGPKVGLRIFPEQYHTVIKESSILSAGFSFNYYLRGNAAE